jgi:hypothetical protein
MRRDSREPRKKVCPCRNLFVQPDLFIFPLNPSIHHYIYPVRGHPLILVTFSKTPLHPTHRKEKFDSQVTSRWISKHYPISSQRPSTQTQMSAKLQSFKSERYRLISQPISQVGNEEGMITALLQIIAADSIDLYVSKTRCFFLK